MIMTKMAHSKEKIRHQNAVGNASPALPSIRGLSKPPSLPGMREDNSQEN